jgi:sugar O-acyltransferase (sialic acid O-acetyltransferase NeuD family)
MKKKLLIFGNGQIAELAHFYFTKFSNLKIEAFILDKEYIKESSFCEKPIISLDNIKEKFNIKEYSFFIALGYQGINEIRKKKYLEIKKLGYEFESFISPNATILSKDIGENCFIFENNVIQPKVKIGNNVTLWSGNHVGHHSTLDDHCFISSHVVISGNVDIGQQTFIGINSTIRDNITIGKKCIIGAGCKILNHAPDFSVYREKNSLRSALTSDKLKQI